ncbi:MAG: protoporphyrinogen oxidase HemJ [Polynucleobacter sp.]|nr:protoporphyrinogen oxidase HemJ [Polynucleobacter sp.]
MSTLQSLYPWIKAFHLIAVVALFAGAFYIFRLYVHHIEATNPEVKATLAGMERKLLKVIMNPALIATWVLGLTLLMLNPVYLTQGWMHVKLLMVLLLSAYHGYAAKVRKQLEAGTCSLTSKQARLINELPTLVLVVVAIMVIVKPF